MSVVYVDPELKHTGLASAIISETTCKESLSQSNVFAPCHGVPMTSDLAPRLDAILASQLDHQRSLYERQLTDWLRKS